MQRYEKALLSLLAVSVDHNYERCDEVFPLSEDEWMSLAVVAGKHNVIGLVFSVVEQLPKNIMPSLDILMDFMAKAEHQKSLYRLQFDTAQRFASALNEKGVEMKILKGISFSTYYDCPELRGCSDCDIYLSISHPKSLINDGSSGYEIGNETIVEIGGGMEPGSYKHSHLFLGRLMFENHHYITDFHGTKRGKQLERFLEETIDSVPGTPIGTSKMVCPCPKFNALHLIRHAQGNLLLDGMSLRMIYDWAVFLRTEQNKLDWVQLYADMDVLGLRKFADVLTGICTRYFGLRIVNEQISFNTSALVDEIVENTMSDRMAFSKKETFLHKCFRILTRYRRMWRYRKLAIESVPMMIWNSFAFSSYTNKKVSLE